MSRTFGPSSAASGPGLVRTYFARALWEGEGEAFVAKRNPARRIGEPEDIAGTALYLASNLAEFVTGEAILVDGGQNVSF